MAAGGGCVEQEHMQGRARTLMFASNVSQACKFAQDPKVKYMLNTFKIRPS